MSRKIAWQAAAVFLMGMMMASCGHKLPPKTQQPALLPEIPFHS